MSEEIENIKLSFTCTENWDAMTQADGGRHCDKCQKKVYDFTNSKADEFRRVLAENNYSVCGRFASQQLNVKSAIFPLWRKWISAALVLIGFNFGGNEATAQNLKHKHAKHKIKFIPPQVSMGDVAIQEPPKVPGIDSSKLIEPGELLKTDTVNAVFGMVSEAIPEFPGGNEKLYSFINKNLNQNKASKPGRVNVTFIVEKDGALSDVRAIGPIFDQNAADEAIRVIKLSPKWIPGKQNGKPVRVQYVVPIVFN